MQCSIGISGIDACGKGYIADKLDRELRDRGLRTAVINGDAWLNSPSVRFGGNKEPGRHFYEHALRYDEMLKQLVLPLKDKRSIRFTADLVTEVASEYNRHEYAFNDIYVILLESIFLFQLRFARHLDGKVWIDCSFEAALRRAVARSQGELSHEATVRVYETIYFTAQRFHFDRDRPRSASDVVIDNEKKCAAIIGSRRLNLLRNKEDELADIYAAAVSKEGVTPYSRATPARDFLSCVLARFRRDMTVPIGISRTCATSL